MAWFVDEERPVPALALDGLGWGAGIGCLLGLLWGPVGAFLGALIAGPLGLLVGLVAGVLLAGWQAVRAPRSVVVAGTLAPVLGLLALLPWWVWGVPPLDGLLFLGVPAAGPLTADVVWRVRRSRPPGVRRPGHRCVVVVGRVVVVVR